MNDYWQLKRKDNAAMMLLPQDMHWADEFDWSRIAQAAPQRTLSGGLVIQQGIKLNGRPSRLQASGRGTAAPRCSRCAIGATPRRSKCS